MAHADFNIVGNVGKVTRIGDIVKVRIASEYGRRDQKSGDFEQNTYWNEVTIFAEKTVTWADETLKPGDIVSVRGTIRQNIWNKDGVQRYDVLLSARSVDLIVVKSKIAK